MLWNQTLATPKRRKNSSHAKAAQKQPEASITTPAATQSQSAEAPVAGASSAAKTSHDSRAGLGVQLRTMGYQAGAAALSESPGIPSAAGQDTQAADVHKVAAAGVQGSGGALPHLDKIQASLLASGTFDQTNGNEINYPDFNDILDEECRLTKPKTLYSTKKKDKKNALGDLESGQRIKMKGQEKHAMSRNWIEVDVIVGGETLRGFINTTSEFRKARSNIQKIAGRGILYAVDCPVALGQGRLF